jgi:hypothetical protein
MLGPQRFDKWQPGQFHSGELSIGGKLKRCLIEVFADQGGGDPRAMIFP